MRAKQFLPAYRPRLPARHQGSGLSRTNWTKCPMIVTDAGRAVASDTRRSQSTLVGGDSATRQERSDTTRRRILNAATSRRRRRTAGEDQKRRGQRSTSAQPPRKPQRSMAGEPVDVFTARSFSRDRPGDTESHPPLAFVRSYAAARPVRAIRLDGITTSMLSPRASNGNVGSGVRCARRGKNDRGRLRAASWRLRLQELERPQAPRRVDLTEAGGGALNSSVPGWVDAIASVVRVQDRHDTSRCRTTRRTD